MKFKPIPASFALGALLFASAISRAAEETALQTTTAQSAIQTEGTATLWASDLEEPQGIVRDIDGDILIAEYGGGRIVKFSRDGRLKRVVASGLKSPAMLVRVGSTIIVSERKANRVARLHADGTLSTVGGEIAEPLGLAIVDNRPVVVSHTTSRVWKFDGEKWQLWFAAKDDGDKRYGYRCLAAEPNGALLMSDEIDGQLLLLTRGGRIALWSKNFSSPSGIAISPSGEVYVADEGDGTLSRVEANGDTKIVVRGLGKPRGILFLDAKTALVTDRSGKVWRVAL